jgi:hypothetical protein
MSQHVREGADEANAMTSPNAADFAVDRRLAYALLRAIIGVNLAIHGISRLLAGPHAFAASLVGAFHATLLPPWSITAFGLVLPWIEAALGLLILLGAGDALRAHRRLAYDPGPDLRLYPAPGLG